MSLFITSLNSGSNGNCYYIGNDNEAILVDAGLSCRETEKRLKRLGLSMVKVKAIFVSHEHGDHITGISVLAKKYQLPVYITSATHTNARLQLDKHLVNSFEAYKKINIGSLSIIAFPKQHDASDPHSFIVAGNAVTVGIFTDIGIACEQVINYFKQCHAAFLEANYDVEMLEKGSYPYHLKNRIRGGMGHLSNAQALQLFTEHRPSFMSHLLLSHLSKNNNSQEIVETLFSPYAATTNIIVASRYKETALFTITNEEAIISISQKKLIKKQYHKTQLSLFE